ncbi:DUF6493 family protein [Hymenobacter metallilatus]|uniref:F-box domain-containing protein n=1 Tax=Hymenobacter metallilatus TaxID=2493666 RepID=A0A3R9MX76_9BACT|nr:DUF6493 family protein [Hymenobacter metallilatus]RSK32539.1 hypothetical protein EI290_12485 [Hymenobacter metallilatus]
MSASAVESFESIIRHQTTPALVEFLLQLPKTDVVAVRQRTRQLRRELEDFRQQPNGNWGRTGTDEQLFMLRLAGLRTYSRKEALSPGFQFWSLLPEQLPHFWAVVEHTRPDWLGDFFRQWADRNAWSRPAYQLLRELEHRQLLAYEPRLFAGAVPALLSEWATELSQQDPIPADALAVVTARLAADPTLLTRDLPLVFDFDTAVDGFQAQVQPPMPAGWRRLVQAHSWHDWQELHPPQQLRWLDVFRNLTEQGHLARPELLNRCLQALRRDFRRPLLTWFRMLFLALRPTPEERLARQTELVDLLAHPLPLVVNFALEQLKDLWQHPNFAADPLLLYAEGLLTRQDVRAGLRTLFGGLEKLLRRTPALAPALATLSTTALANADAAVQERAARLLHTVLGARRPLLSAAEAADLTANLCLYAELLTPPARQLLAPYLPAPEAPSAADHYAPHSGFVPDISPATALEPVRDWHELLFLTGQVLQQHEPAAVERWVEGLLRMHGQYPADYARQLHPYLVQALRWQLKGKSEEETRAALLNYSFNDSHNGRPELVLALLVSWYLGFPRLLVAQVPLRPHTYSRPDPLLHLEQQRLAAAEAALQQGRPLPLLSTPSHAPHWVAPSVLLRRLLDYEEAGQEPNAADLTLALARTAVAAPTDVAEARRLLPLFRHPELRPLLTAFLGPEPTNWALPAFTRPPQEKRLTERLSQLIPFLRRPASGSAPALTDALPWLWAIAARTRQPQAELPALQALGTYPGLAQPWQPTWKLTPKSHTYSQTWNKAQPTITNTWTELSVQATTPARSLPSGFLLYSLHAAPERQHECALWPLTSALPFLLTLLPNHPDTLLWHVVQTAARTVDKEVTGQQALQAVLTSLLGPGPVFTEVATLLLALSLTHAAPTTRALALEVVLAAIGHQRLVPEALGRTLGRLLAAEFVPVLRLAEALSAARAISGPTDDALRQLLEALLPLLPAVPLRNTRKLIEAYVDLLTRARRIAPETVQQQFHTWSTSATLKKAATCLAAA